MAIAVSFFSGAGGLDKGIKDAGFDLRLTVEIKEKYCKTLLLNHPEINVRQGDILDYNREKVYMEAGLSMDQEIDLLFGGSPCQSFSTAGNRQGFSDARGKAMLKFAELVRTVKPKVFLLENVRGLLSAALRHRPINQRIEGCPPLELDEIQGSALQYLLDQFTGYSINYELLNAANFGVPQTRERVFFVGVRNDISKKYIFPQRTHNEYGNDLPKWNSFGDLLKEIKVTKHHYVEYSRDRLHYMKMIPQGGGNWNDLPENIIRDAMGGAYESGGGRVGFYRRIWANKPSPTLLTSPIQKSTNIGHPFEDRPLSIEEYLAVQQFPVDYQLFGTLSQQYIQIGNAVPIGLARILGNSIIKFLD
jgi:DNA (cytosine-5)-methyltransferase 1